MRRLHLGFLLKDLLFITCGAWTAIKVINVPSRAIGEVILAAALYASFTILIFQNLGMYRSSLWERRHASVCTACNGAFAAIGLVLAINLLLGRLATLPAIGLLGLFNLGAIICWIFLERWLIASRLARGEGVRNVAIVGTGQMERAIAKHLEDRSWLGYNLRGFVDDHPSPDVPLLGRIDDLPEIVRSEFLDEIFIPAPKSSDVVARVLAKSRPLHCDVKVIPESYGLKWPPIEYLGEIPVCQLHTERTPAAKLAIKRTIDLVLALASTILLLPVFAAIAIAIKIDSHGPVIYCATRIGKKGRRFPFYKFRTMVANADEVKHQYMGLNEREGPFFKLSNDPRVTRFGAWLRKYSLDELPQLWNVILGHMSLVGPRPHPIDDFEKYSLEHRRRLDITPGITGMWQVSARLDSSWKKNMEFDLYYIEHWSLWLDFKILWKTLPTVLEGSGQ